ncbi:hypothetical protein HZI73_18115 [Vallitalea pronyensis]|uniref:Mor transcription activator domain-containing protein n=1 Tax=Vallitalea pronyensis TaxID=1348613 RepID=A0A8J8MLX2_9FIRM|nr:CD3324 family protein [Vallitalea pronyensis]QUI24090.1 hypothetical protein HZI73_18115 [Vallitalea pronyensis]
MNYVNAKKILPEHLVKEIQQYVQGGFIYIPSQPETRKRWGEKSGYRDRIKRRNMTIKSKYLEGYTKDDLAKEYCLSMDSIHKIIYKKI